MRLLIVILALATATTAAMAREKTIEALRAEAEAARPDEQPQLFAELVLRQVELANKSYNAGDPGKAEDAVKQGIQFAERARDVAVRKGGKMKGAKKTEIKLRKAQRRLADIGRTLSFDYRPPVEQAVQRLEEIRRDLLEGMFGVNMDEEKR